jgi:hypothetical protein
VAARNEVEQKKVELADITEKVKDERTKVDEAKKIEQQRKAEILQTNPGAGQGSAESSGAAGGSTDAGQYPEGAFKNLSICEKFDVLSDDNPEVAARYGLDWNQKVERLAELDAMLERSAVIVTKNNLVTSPTAPKDSDDPKQLGKFRKGDKVYIYIWFSTPKKPQTVFIEYLDGSGKPALWGKKNKVRRKKVTLSAPNRLQGERLGFRLWTMKQARAWGPKKHRINVFNNDKELLCQREFEVEK